MRSGGWPRFTGRGVSLAVACAVTLLVWGFVQIREVLDLAVLQASALAVGLAWVGVGRLAGLPARIEGAANRSLASGEVARVEASMRNRLSVPVQATALWRVDGREQRARVGVAAGGRAVIGVRVRGGRRGVGVVELAGAEVTDPMGLLAWRWAVRAGARIAVLPQLLEGVREPVGSGAAGPAGVRAEAGQPGGSLREYRAGDAMRRIHWKQSARQGKLLVHEPESGAGRRADVVLVTDPVSYPGGGGGGAPAFERAVSLVATLACDWMRRGEEARVFLDDPATAPLPARDEGSLLSALAEVRIGGPARRAWAGPAASRRVVVTGRIAGRAARLLGEGGGAIVTTDADAPGSPPGADYGAWRVFGFSDLVAGGRARRG